MNQLDFYYYFLKSTVNTDDGVINSVLKIDGKDSVPISTRIKTKKSQWNAKDQCFEGKDSAKKEALKRNFEKRMESIRDVLAQEQTLKSIDPNDILAIHRQDKKQQIEEKRPEGKQKQMLLEHFRLYIKQQQELVDVGRLAQVTVDGYIAKRNTVVQYLIDRKLIGFRTEQFTEAVMLDFEHYLIMKGQADSTIAKYKRLVKTVTTWAKQKGFTKIKPLEDYKIENAPDKEPISLDRAELQKIEDAQNDGRLNDDLSITADIYRFCAETSLSHGDYNSLRNSMMKTGKNGTKWINRPRGKTKVEHRIPLSEKALDILNKYGTLEDLPRKSNQKSNIGIRKVAKIVGIEKYLTFHTSRKTAVDDMFNVKGMRETVIQKVVGWKSSRQLKLYAKVKDSTIEREFFGE
ncbi:phage integrase family protein [Arcicella aurantiaca]|uniref:Phage integrase family protein n=1 Tax=Arcicella aurantiaca TaxID=591202 RepID=A0A316EAJ4_9BACT|nr:tyrosine-type recombinase/integrase [Arcicella aurantiaca]PWK27152.1 phage integrase family protein [Arcicella aurantiaca]